MAGAARVNCFRCRHFFVTWDPRFPRGCRALGFMGRAVPSDTVRQASGIRCLYFEPRSPTREPRPTGRPR